MRDVCGLATAGFFADLAGEPRGQLVGGYGSFTRLDGCTARKMTVRSRYRGVSNCFFFFSLFRRFRGSHRSSLADPNLREVTRSAPSHWLPALITVLGFEMILREPLWVTGPFAGAGRFRSGASSGPWVASTDLRPASRVEVGEVKE